MKTYFGLPKKVIFCKKTHISNQRPVSKVEFFHNKKTKTKTLNIDKNGLSDSWKYSRLKKKINYQKREKELLNLLSKHRGKYGKYDCIVPGSGGKDSCYAAHILKYKYGMNPLTVTWPAILKTEYGKKNFDNWLETGKFDNISAKRPKALTRFLTSKAVKNLLHPFHIFILGQKVFPIKIALKMGIPLVFYGENEAEHGNPIADNSTSLRKNSYHTFKDKDRLFISGIKAKDLISKYRFKEKDLDIFLPPKIDQFKKNNVEVHYLGYYLKWIQQEAYYYSVENCNFKPRPFRSMGTFTKFSSIDDKIDDLHFYTYFIKFGIGRATFEVSQEIRNDHLTTSEGLKLIEKYDGEYPYKYIDEILDYLSLTKNQFSQLCNKFRSPHLWTKNRKNLWTLRHNANRNGFND
jgi:N-acetyl sugar amidotransferase